MKIYIIDDDEMICGLLQRIINDKQLGNPCGHATNGEDALEDLRHVKPDIVLVDLLMPIMDGLTFVEKAKALYPDIIFVMLSQVDSKELIAMAYEKGVSFYIQKPVNAVEVVNVLKNVGETIQMKRTFQQMQSILSGRPLTLEEMVNSNETYISPNEGGDSIQIKNLKKILSQIGIIGENGSSDIIAFVEYLITNEEVDGKYTVREICEKIGDASAKSMEQRIRRTAFVGLSNLAHMGIEDYTSDIFNRYANAIYNYEQVRMEMNYIRGTSKVRGKVSLKSFLNSLAYYSMNNK